MQADAFADQARRDHITFQHLPGEVDARYPGHADPVGILQQGHQQRQNHAEAEAEERHEGQDAGDNADRQGIIQSGCPQCKRVIQRQGRHHRQLATQEFADDRVHVAGNAGDGIQPAPRCQCHDPRHHVVPVPQQIEHHYRNQQQIGQHADDGNRTGLQGGEPGGAVLGDLLGEPCHQCGQVEVDAEGLLQPGHEAGLQEVENRRRTMAQLGELPLEQGKHDQQQDQHAQRRQYNDGRGADRARQSACFQPIDQRVENVGQQGARQKRREDGTEQIDQSAGDEQCGECKPGDVARVGGAADGVHRR